MAAISLQQLDTIAAFLETSRNYLDVEHAIRLHWPLRSPTLPKRPNHWPGKPARRAKSVRSLGSKPPLVPLVPLMPL